MKCLICENEMECLDDGYRVGYTREIYECDNCEALTEVYYSKNNYGSKDGRKILNFKTTHSRDFSHELVVIYVKR